MKVMPTKIVALDPMKARTERQREVAVHVQDKELHAIIDVHRVRNEKPEPLEYVIDSHLRAGIPAVLAAPWRGDIAAARPQAEAPQAPAPRPAIVVERIAEAAPAQHPLAVYEQLLMNARQGVAA